MGPLDVTLSRGAIDRGTAATAGPRGRVAVVFEPCRAGAAVLRDAAQRAEAGSELSVVTLAPQARPLRCCGGGGAGPYNCAVRSEAEDELHSAREMLGSVAARATFTVLAGCPDPPLSAWVAEHEFDVVLLPRHRFTRGGHCLARSLRKATAAEVRLVS